MPRERKKYTVMGNVECTLSIDVWAYDDEDPLKIAAKNFNGVRSYAGNGGTDKLVGVEGDGESIQCDEEPVWDDVLPYTG